MNFLAIKQTSLIAWLNTHGIHRLIYFKRWLQTTDKTALSLKLNWKQCSPKNLENRKKKSFTTCSQLSHTKFIILFGYAKGYLRVCRQVELPRNRGILVSVVTHGSATAFTAFTAVTGDEPNPTIARVRGKTARRGSDTVCKQHPCPWMTAACCQVGAVATGLMASTVWIEVLMAKLQKRCNVCQVHMRISRK